MSTHTNSSVSSRVYKENYYQQARKQLARFGELQKIILEFSKHHVLIQAAQVREWAKQRYSIDLNLKRIHDAIKRLERKKIVECISRGVYRLTELGKKLLSSILSMQYSDKETESEFAVRGVRDVVFGRYRLHVRGGSGFEDVVRQLYAVRRVVDCALAYLRSVVGKSRFYRIVRGVDVGCVDFFVGGHGVPVLGRSRSLKRPLLSLGSFESLGIKPAEVGVDVFAVSSVKPSVKLYFA